MKYLVFPLALMASQATAEHQCYPTEEAHNSLIGTLGLLPEFSGLTRDGPLIEIFTDKRSGSWIVLQTLPSGISCIVVGGQYYTVEPLGQDG